MKELDGVGGIKQDIPKKIFKKLFKNAITPKNREGTPWNFLQNIIEPNQYLKLKKTYYTLHPPPQDFDPRSNRTSLRT